MQGMKDASGLYEVERRAYADERGCLNFAEMLENVAAFHDEERFTKNYDALGASW